jgi:hypothetical protein
MTPYQLLQREPVHVSSDIAWLWGHLWWEPY